MERGQDSGAWGSERTGKPGAGGTEADLRKDSAAASLWARRAEAGPWRKEVSQSIFTSEPG